MESARREDPRSLSGKHPLSPLGQAGTFLENPLDFPAAPGNRLGAAGGSNLSTRPCLGMQGARRQGDFKYTLPQSETQDLVFLIVLWLG